MRKCLTIKTFNAMYGGNPYYSFRKKDPNHPRMSRSHMIRDDAASERNSFSMTPEESEQQQQ